MPRAARRRIHVAVTRARERVHLLGCVKLDDDGTPRAPDKRSLLAKLWPLEVPITRAAPAAAPASPVPSVPLRRLPAAYAPPAPPPPVAWQAPPEGREEEPIEFSWAGETARHVGVVVHRWLQRIAEDELKGWDVKRVESLRSHFERDLRCRGVQDLKPAVNLVVTAVRNSVTDERGRWILGPHLEAKTEYRVRTPHRSYVVDRFFREPGGARWVVDYKTSRHEGANINEFIDREWLRYSRQLEEYRQAVDGTNAGIFFPILGKFK